MSQFRRTLVATLRSIRSLFEIEGVQVIGSQVPNLLQFDTASLPVVSRDVDIGLPVYVHPELKRRLGQVPAIRPSQDEPSVWVGTDLLEVNFVGIDASLTDPMDVRLLEDDQLPLMVFGALSLLRPGPTIDIDGTLVPTPDPATLALEKLITERSGVKGDRDLLVVLGLEPALGDEAMVRLSAGYRQLPVDLRHQVRCNLALLSLIDGVEGMPDPKASRAWVASFIRRLECVEEGT